MIASRQKLSLSLSPEFFSSPMGQITQILIVNFVSTLCHVNVSVRKRVHRTFVEHGAACSRLHQRLRINHRKHLKQSINQSSNSIFPESSNDQFDYLDGEFGREEPGTGVVSSSLLTEGSSSGFQKKRCELECSIHETCLDRGVIGSRGESFFELSIEGGGDGDR